MIFRGDADEWYCVRRSSRGTMDLRLAKEPLKTTFSQFESLPLMDQISNRVVIDKEPLDRPYSTVYCVCETIAKPPKPVTCASCEWVYHPNCVGQSKSGAKLSPCGFCSAQEDSEGNLVWKLNRKIIARGKRKKNAPTHEDVVLVRSKVDHEAGPTGVLRYKGSTAWVEEEQVLRVRGEENRKKSKQYKDSAQRHADKLSKDGGGHHVIDEARGGSSGVSRAPMTDHLVESLLEDEGEMDYNNS